MGKPHIKGVELTTKEKNGRPKSIKKDLKPITHKWIGLRKTKERKEETQPVKIKKLKGSPVIRTRLRYLGIARSSGSSGHATKLG